MMNCLKNRKTEALFIITLSVLFSYSLFADHVLQGHDCLFHMNRIQGVVNALQDHQFLPAIYPYANNGYGYASPLFYCDLAVYPFAVLYWLGLPLVVTYKLMIGFYGVLSVISIFCVLKQLFKKTVSAPYIGTILYTFCNYHLYDQYLRQAFGEILALVVIPWVLLGIYEVLVEHKDSWIKLGVSFALLLLSHILSFALYAVLFAVFIVVFLFANLNKKDVISGAFITTIKAVGLALLLTTFHLMPMLEQMSDQTFNANLYSKTYDIMKSTLSYEMLLYPFCNINGVEFGGYFAFNVGLVYLLIPFVYLYLLAKGKGSLIITVIFAISYVCIMFSAGIVPFMSSLSFLNVLQFSYRFNLIAFPLLTFVIVYCLSVVDSRVFLLSSILIICYSLANCLAIHGSQLAMNNVENPQIYNYQTHLELYDKVLVKDSYDYNNLEISGAEYLPPTEQTNYLKESVEIKTTDGIEYCEIFLDDGCLPYGRDGTCISFTHYFDKEETVMLPLTYYKGYNVTVDGQKADIVRLDKFKKVAFMVSPGEHECICHYDGTRVQKISLLVSAVTCGVLIISTIKRTKYRISSIK